VEEEGMEKPDIEKMKIERDVDGLIRVSQNFSSPSG